tara:strand:- start:671 stop:922 length:252 start_codon:yes stop_codon:yes gene_type:complete
MANILQERQIEILFESGSIPTLIDYLMEVFPEDIKILELIDADNTINFFNVRNSNISTDVYYDVNEEITQRVKNFLLTKDIKV